ncbi:hypothetical protein [Ralstonia flatus]|nr:hypothetical protein [Ralstonia sp. LMG 32965]MBN6209411.1 hypothetical protein [Ralstonia pickettii]
MHTSLRMLPWALRTLSFLTLGAVTLAQAQECDCTQIVGTCNANIQMTPTGSQKGLYGADLLIRADAPACAKVEYLVDSTPAFTILPNGKEEGDRVMGTSEKPIRKKQIVLQTCRICKTADQAAADRAKDEQQKAEAEARAQQAEVERLVSEGLQGGSLQPKPYGSRDTVMDSVVQLQSQLARQSGSQPSKSQGTRTTGDPCTARGFRTCNFGAPNPGSGRSELAPPIRTDR